MSAFYRACALALGIVCLGSTLAAQDIPWISFSGPARYPHNLSPADETAARQAHQAVGATFMIWFRLDGRAYVSDDRSTMDRMNYLTNLKLLQPNLLENVERVRQENAQYAAANPVTATDANAAELRQLAESIRQMASAPPTSNQDVTDLKRRLLVMMDNVMKMQAQVARRETVIMALRSNEQRLQEYGTERQILQDAIASGKARLAP